MNETAGVILVIGGIGCMLLLMLTLGMISESNVDDYDQLELPDEGRIYFMKGSSCVYLDYKLCDVHQKGGFIYIRDYVIAQDDVLCVTRLGGLE